MNEWMSEWMNYEYVNEVIDRDLVLHVDAVKPETTKN